MNEDYLWDKTGGDPEIERLENALAAFRYNETAAPALESKILAFKPKPARKVFQFKYAAAACLTFAAFAAVISIQISADKTNNETDSARAVETENSASFESKNRMPNVPTAAKPDDSGIEKPSVLPIKKIENSTGFAAPKFVKIARRTPANNQTRPAKPSAVKTEIKLTDEERYAYKQLLLALSVTSSKLKLVKNKVESSEEKTVVEKIPAKDAQ